MYNEALLGFNHRKLDRGELCLLAKAIADTRELPSADALSNFPNYLISIKKDIYAVCYELAEYAFIDSKEMAFVCEQVGSFMIWRASIAHQPSTVLFTGDPNNVIDDITSIRRYVDTSVLCDIVNVLDRANWLYRTFRELCVNVRESTQNSTVTK